MSFAGEPYSEVPGRTVSPGGAGTRLNGRYSLERGTISFTSAGRFQRSTAPKADALVKTTLAPARDGSGNDDLAGTYSLSRYALTLRYDSGRIERMLFFLESPKQESLWFEGGWISKIKPK